MPEQFNEEEFLSSQFDATTIQRAKEIKESGHYRQQAVLVVVNDNDEVLLTQAAKPLRQRNMVVLSLPQGGAEEDGQSMHEVAAREINEEIFGLDATPEDLREIEMDGVDTTQVFSLKRICEELVDKDRSFAGKQYNFFVLHSGNKVITGYDKDEIESAKFFPRAVAIEQLREKGTSNKFEMQKEAILRSSVVRGE